MGKHKVELNRDVLMRHVCTLHSHCCTIRRIFYYSF